MATASAVCSISPRREGVAPVFRHHAQCWLRKAGRDAEAFHEVVVAAVLVLVGRLQLLAADLRGVEGREERLLPAARHENCYDDDHGPNPESRSIVTVTVRIRPTKKKRIRNVWCLLRCQSARTRMSRKGQGKGGGSGGSGYCDLHGLGVAGLGVEEVAPCRSRTCPPGSRVGNDWDLVVVVEHAVVVETAGAGT